MCPPSRRDLWLKRCWGRPRAILSQQNTFTTRRSLGQHICDAAPPDERVQHLAALRAYRRQLALWAENCPENYANRATLVGAEIARVEGRDFDAMRAYDQAIKSARENGFVQNEGIANELAARFYLKRGFDKIAHVYLRDARSCYLRWGALGKVKQLDQCYPCREEPLSQEVSARIGQSFDQLDLVTVVKASQAVSGEILLGKLIETLMVIAIEHAGAERGLLILPRKDDYQIEAEATTSRDKVQVDLGQAPAATSKLPMSILHYVIRTRQSVIPDDALVPNPFSEDENLLWRRPRSILCVPLTGINCWTRDNATEPTMAPWRAKVLERGYASSISLPLLSQGEAFGALSLYAPEPDAFNQSTAEQYTDLANNLAFGVMALRTRKERTQAENEIRQLNASLEKRVAKRTIELARSEEKFRALFEGTSQAVVLHDEHGILEANPSGFWAIPAWLM
jgi:GAF domain-containing protein